MGGTSACIWLDPAQLDTPALHCYFDKYEVQIAQLDEVESRREWEKPAVF